MCLRYKLKTKLKVVVRADPRSKRYFIKEHFNGNRDPLNKVSGDQVQVDLKCPISARKMEIPIKTRNCEHAQAFGLETLVRVAKTDTIFNLIMNHCSAIQCPICKKSGLMVQDKFTSELLKNSPSHIVYLNRKGEVIYGPEIKEEPVEVITIEDDKDECKEKFMKNNKENHKQENKKRAYNDYQQAKRLKPLTSSNKQRNYNKRRHVHSVQDSWYYDY